MLSDFTASARLKESRYRHEATSSLTSDKAANTFITPFEPEDIHRLAIASTTCYNARLPPSTSASCIKGPLPNGVHGANGWRWAAPSRPSYARLRD